jgi:2-polyprenyl-3-methyl-5-hydroxy-6-metoxy-1,4-benzoquinol methylase
MNAVTERARCAHLVGMLAGRRYGRVLEIGCGAGALTGLLAPHANRIVALDISQAAIAQARAPGGGASVEFRVANIMDYRPQEEGPWDKAGTTGSSAPGSSGPTTTSS